MKLIDSAHTHLLSRAMDTYTMRQRLNATNIANSEAPGFTRKSVRFEEELQRAQMAGGVRAMKEVTPSIELTDRPVELEEELMEMADTQIRAHLATRSLRHHFELMRTGITGINR